jgi:hypothetical protein
MVVFNVWAKKHTGVNAHRSQAIDDKTKCGKKGKANLIQLDMRKNQILSNKGWRNGESG